MHIDIIDEFSSIADLKQQWDAVYDADPDAQFFLSSTWIFPWMSDALSLRIILAARAEASNSDYVAFFPMRLRAWPKKGGGFYTILDMACQGIADYTGFICHPDYDAEVIPAFAEAIKQFKWQELDLAFVCASQERTQLLLQQFPNRSYRVKTKQEGRKPGGIDHYICPYIELPDDWETYLQTKMSANSRQKARRLLKKIESSDSLEIRPADRTTIERDVDTVLQLWDTKWSAHKRSNLDVIVNIVRKMILECFEKDSLFLPILWHGEQAVCGLALLVDRRKRSYLFMLTGRDEAFDDLQAGFALHAYAIRHAIENGFGTYDFLQGNDRYKYSFGVQERTVLDRLVSPKVQQAVLDERCLDSALARTRKLHNQGKLSEAERGYRQIMRLDPQCTGAVYGLGNLLASKGDHTQAEKLLKSLTNSTPEPPAT